MFKHPLFDTNINPMHICVQVVNKRRLLNFHAICFSFFASLLKELGPLHVTDSKIEDEVNDFPPEARDLIQSAGGIGQFLSKSLQFFHMDGYVCLMVDAPKAQNLAMTNKQSIDGQTKKQKTRALPPDTRSRDQFPALGATAPEDSTNSQFYKNNGNISQNPNVVRPVKRDSILRRQTSTPDSECTSSSDPLDNFLSHLSQTLSQSSIDDRDKNDVALAMLSNRDSVDGAKSPRATPSDYGSSLYMPSAYGDSKSQESISDSISSGFMSNIIPNANSQASVDSSGDTGLPLVVDTTKEDHDVTPPMTSPGLIHDMMGAKPLTHSSLIDHPLMKASSGAESKTPDSDENRNHDAGDGPNIDVGSVVPNLTSVILNKSNSTEEHPSPLPEARSSGHVLPQSSSVQKQYELLAPGTRLTPEQATITPPRPRNTSPKAHEPDFSALGFILPPHPDEELQVASSAGTPMNSLAHSSMPSWINTTNIGVLLLKFEQLKLGVIFRGT